ncbi:MAG: two pore domain potassium channel family protein [Methylococcaceae bacterium]|nr:two pore domain potassium channel family protein [Methylococcaceae bacterium]
MCIAENVKMENWIPVVLCVIYFVFVFLFLFFKSDFKKHIDKKCKYEICVYFLSGTLLFASYKKSLEPGPGDKANLIRKFNKRYFWDTLLIAVFFLFKCLLPNEQLDKVKDWWPFVICIYLIGFYAFSRVNEVFFAFIRDARDKLDFSKNDSEKESSDLKFYERIKLAMVSYLELIFLYGILQFILSIYGCGLDDGNKWIANIWDSVYFSGITIATVGYGDLHPISGFSKFLAVYEVINGVVLIVVSFTIYVSRSISDNEYREKNDGETAKELLAELMVDLIKNKPDVFSEAFESVGLANAITEGRKNDFVSEEEVFSVLIRAVQEHQKRNLRKTQS